MINFPEVDIGHNFEERKDGVALKSTYADLTGKITLRRYRSILEHM